MKDIFSLYLFYISEKISADEFFKATGIRVNEPVSTIKTSEEYLQNLNPSDHIYSSTKAINTTNFIDNELPLDIDNENSNNFSIESLSYQDLINSLPVSLISAPSTESSLETSDLPFIISDKNLDIDKLPETILEDVKSPINSMSNTFELLEVMTQTDSNSSKDKLEESTQTDINLINYNVVKTEVNLLSCKLEECTQTDCNFVKNYSEETTQTESSFLKDKLSSKKKLKRLLQNKKNEIRDWKMKTQHNIDNVMDNITLEQYESLTEKFFPKETSEFIKIQAKLFKKKTNDRKYSLGFKKQCLSLFLAGPKTYKNLQKIFCLPGENDLQTLKF